MVTGLLCLVLAVVLETLAPVLFALGSGHGQLVYEAEVVIEEALELLGWGAMAVGLAAAVLDQALALGSRSAVLAEGRRSAHDPH